MLLLDVELLALVNCTNSTRFNNKLKKIAKKYHLKTSYCKKRQKALLLGLRRPIKKQVYNVAIVSKKNEFIRREIERFHTFNSNVVSYKIRRLLKLGLTSGNFKMFRVGGNATFKGKYKHVGKSKIDNLFDDDIQLWHLKLHYFLKSNFTSWTQYKQPLKVITIAKKCKLNRKCLRCYRHKIEN